MTEPQAEFYQLGAKFPAFIGGFGSGKTKTLTDCAFRDALESPSALIALYEPTYDLVRLILAPRMEDMLAEQGMRYKYNKQENIIYVSSAQCGDFVMRTLENPARIIGYESYRAHVDEIDTLKKAQAVLAWNKIIARNRQKPKGADKIFNRVSVYSTPEGFNFVYDRWVKNAKPGYVMVKAKTLSNPFLPDDYVDSLREAYPPQLIDAYINGEFVNMASGSVYPNFDRKLNNTFAHIEEGEPLHVGMDFNVLNMSAIVTVTRGGAPHALQELTKVRDTPTMARLLKERYKDKGHHVTVYPDASGASTSSKNASESDLTILRQAELSIRVNRSNPSIKDRVNAVNALILNSSGVRRLKVNTLHCPTLTESLEQQAYDKNGEPDKSSGMDHTNDALGYRCVMDWAIKRPASAPQSLRA
jgi:hypothetical protein